jgi:hypothetical protein
VVSKRPMNGHGREMVQLGVPMADAPPDVDNMTASTKGKSPYNAHMFYLCFFLQSYYLTFPASIITINEVLLIESDRKDCRIYTFLVSRYY